MKINFPIKKLYQVITLIFLAILIRIETNACSFRIVRDVNTAELLTSCEYLDPSTSSMGPITNCAAQNQKVVDNALASDKVFFCSSESKVVECPTSAKSFSYDDVFQRTTSTTRGTYNYVDLKAATGCKYVVPRTSASVCRHKTTTATDTNCTFGNMKTETGSENCAENSSEGSYDMYGKKVYCAPNNQKVHCDSSISYKDLFSPVQTYNNTTGRTEYDYNSKTLSDTAKNSNNCKVGLPIVSITSGCTINANSLSDSACQIPSDCWDRGPQVINKVSPSIQGGLYCISGNSNPKEGTVYFCPNQIVSWPAINRTRRYDEIAEKKTVNGEIGVYLKPSAGVECIPAINTNVLVRDVSPLSPIGLIRSVSNFLFYFAIFYFIVLMLSNAFAYVRSGEDPTALKKIKESLFNTIAGFLFVLASGGVIVYLINQLTS